MTPEQVEATVRQLDERLTRCELWQADASARSDERWSSQDRWSEKMDRRVDDHGCAIVDLKVTIARWAALAGFGGALLGTLIPYLLKGLG